MKDYSGTLIDISFLPTCAPCPGQNWMPMVVKMMVLLELQPLQL